jgi:hypothetical protein
MGILKKKMNISKTLFSPVVFRVVKYCVSNTALFISYMLEFVSHSPSSYILTSGSLFLCLYIVYKAPKLTPL